MFYLLVCPIYENQRKYIISILYLVLDIENWHNKAMTGLALLKPYYWDRLVQEELLDCLNSECN